MQAGQKISLFMRDPIVLVDDDTDDRDLLAEVLEKIGQKRELEHFENGKDALEYLRVTTDKPFIIICDLNMPIMNGLELKREIQRDDYLRNKSIPFVFFSTAVAPATVMEAYHLSSQGFFLKEPSFRELEETMSLIFRYWTKCKHPNAVR
jgi:CheY-like chemotaxis protein